MQKWLRLLLQLMYYNRQQRYKTSFSWTEKAASLAKNAAQC
ncbi:MAG: hypothetical protein AAFP02_01365 [Bacteroidota bacterium]